MLYDSEEKTEWVTAKDIDVDIMANYVEENGISLEAEEWKWLGSRIKKEQNSWFNLVQEQLVDVRQMAEYDRLVKRLHTLHKKRDDIFDSDSVKFGRAFKEGLDIGKHGGRISLPGRLHGEVSAKLSSYAHNFIKLEEEWEIMK